MVYKKNLQPAQVGQRIRQIRADKTLDEFAGELGVKNPTIYRYETDRIPDAEMLIQIAELGSVSVDWLLTGENRPPRVGEFESGYGKDRELINIVRDIKRIWSAASENDKQLLRDYLRWLKRAVGIT